MDVEPNTASERVRSSRYVDAMTGDVTLEKKSVQHSLYIKAAEIRLGSNVGYNLPNRSATTMAVSTSCRVPLSYVVWLLSAYSECH